MLCVRCAQGMVRMHCHCIMLRRHVRTIMPLLHCAGVWAPAAVTVMVSGWAMWVPLTRCTITISSGLAILLCVVVARDSPGTWVTARDGCFQGDCTCCLPDV